MIAIVDYGAGNIFSVKNALDYLGLESQLTDDAHTIQTADAIIFPGVGAFPSAMQMLHGTEFSGNSANRGKEEAVSGYLSWNAADI